MCEGTHLMVGQAITRGFARKLDAFGEEKVFELYLEHRSVRRLLKVLPPSVGTMSNGPFYAWLHASPERWERWQLTKAMIAQDLVEEALAIVDDADDGSIQSARLRSEQRRWMAERYDRPSFGRNASMNVTVVKKNLDDEFLEALKKVSARRDARRLKAKEIPEAEIVIQEVPEEQDSRTHTEPSKNTPEDVAPLKPVQQPIQERKRRLSRGWKK